MRIATPKNCVFTKRPWWSNTCKLVWFDLPSSQKTHRFKCMWIPKKNTTKVHHYNRNANKKNPSAPPPFPHLAFQHPKQQPKRIAWPAVRFLVQVIFSESSMLVNTGRAGKPVEHWWVERWMGMTRITRIMVRLVLGRLEMVVFSDIYQKNLQEKGPGLPKKRYYIHYDLYYRFTLGIFFKHEYCWILVKMMATYGHHPIYLYLKFQ